MEWVSGLGPEIQTGHCRQCLQSLRRTWVCFREMNSGGVLNWVQESPEAGRSTERLWSDLGSGWQGTEGEKVRKERKSELRKM